MAATHEPNEEDRLVERVEEALANGPPKTASELLDAAHATDVVADEVAWWVVVWPLVQRIEQGLRAGRTGDHDAQRELARVLVAKSVHDP